MSGLPEITVAGTLTRDPDLRFTDKGVAVATFIVAANDRRYDSNTGKWEDFGATFLRCSAWRGTAEHLGESMSKGDRVMVTGVMRQRDYEDGEGTKRTAFDVDVSEVGASLKWATVAVRKANRNSTNGTQDQRQPASEPPF